MQFQRKGWCPVETIIIGLVAYDDDDMVQCPITVIEFWLVELD